MLGPLGKIRLQVLRSGSSFCQNSQLAAGPPVQQGFHIQPSGFADGVREPVGGVGLCRVIVDQPLLRQGDAPQAPGHGAYPGFHLFQSMVPAPLLAQHPVAVRSEHKEGRVVQVGSPHRGALGAGSIHRLSAGLNPVWKPAVLPLACQDEVQAGFQRRGAHQVSAVFGHIAEVSHPQGVIVSHAIRRVEHSAVTSRLFTAPDQLF